LELINEKILLPLSLLWAKVLSIKYMRINMKYITAILFMVMTTSVFATEQSVQLICRTMSTGDVKGLETIFDSQIEMSILGESVVCNRDYAIEKITDFVSNNPSGVCRVSHHGKKENSSFCIISITSSGHYYRLYALFRKVSNNQLIQQFRIDDVTE
jgi:hypothetical protein